MSIREKIVESYRSHGACIPLSDIAVELNLALEELAILIGREDRLNDLCELSVEQAKELVQYYGPRFLFSEKTQSHIDDYLVVRKKLDSIEATARGKDPKSSNDDD